MVVPDVARPRTPFLGNFFLKPNSDSGQAPNARDRGISRPVASLWACPVPRCVMRSIRRCGLSMRSGLRTN